MKDKTLGGVLLQKINQQQRGGVILANAKMTHCYHMDMDYFPIMVYPKDNKKIINNTRILP